MVLDRRYERACLLAEQGRFALAEKEALAALAENPESDRAHNILSYCYLHQARYEAATTSARQAISLAPDNGFHHYRLASVYRQSGQYSLAMSAIETSLKLDPTHLDTYSLAASVCYREERIDQMLIFANKGLALNPEHEGCWDMRVLGLLSQGNLEQAESEIVRLLARYPDRAFSHAAKGWLAIYQDRGRKSVEIALEAFKTALQIAPESDWARQGMMESLRSRNIFYRWVLRYSFWQSRLSRASRGAFWAFWLLLPPVRGLYGLLVLLVWTIRQVSTTALRLHPYGRLLFTPQEKWLHNSASLMIGLMVLAATVAIVRNEGLWLVLIGPPGLIAWLATIGWTQQGRGRAVYIGFALIAGLIWMGAVAELLLA